MLAHSPRLVAPSCAKEPRRALALDSLTRPKMDLPAFEPEPPTAPVSKRELERVEDQRRCEDRPPSGSMELLEGDFIEIDVDPEEFGETKEQAPQVEPPTSAKPTIVDPAKARYIVTETGNPGELLLRPLRPGEPPPPEAPIAKLTPSCNYDSFRIAKILNQR